MLPVVTLARHYRSEKVDFDFIMPRDKKIARLLDNANWLHLIVPEKFPSRSSFNREHVSALQYRDADEHFKAVNSSMDVILSHLNGLDRSRLKALEWSLNEITDNVLNHSESALGGILQVVTFPKSGLVQFYVCDAGIGIPSSLRSGKPEISDDVSALRAAIEEGVTKNSSTNQGNGLFGTFQCCAVSGGEFHLVSGKAFLEYRNTTLVSSKNVIPFKGTFVRASIKYNVEQLLEKALVFKGKKHTPPYDYVERVYQERGNDINLKVKDEFDSFGSRDAGRLARNKVTNLMNNRTTPVVFDFMDVGLISSSFADELFAKLFVELGPIRFGQLCRLENVDATVQALIDRAISQRMRQIV